MRWQDRDLKKIKKFIKSFGLRLYFRPYSRYTGMAEYVSGERITVFVGKKINKTEVILSLLHEIGHHIDWINNKEFDKGTSQLYDGFDEELFKKHVKSLLEVERAGIQHMSSIHKILDLEIPLKKVKDQEKIDLFNYKFFAKNKRYPTGNEIYKFEKRLKRGKRKKRRI